MNFPRTKILSRSSVVVAFLGVAGCGTMLEVGPGLETELREPKAFSSFLAHEYQDRAHSEAYRDGNWFDAVQFVRRMHEAASGKPPPPLNPDDFAVGDHRAELENGYASLMRVLAEGAATAHPRACAKAQRHFDGWIEQASDNKWGDGGSYFGGDGGPVQPAWAIAERTAFIEALGDCRPIERVEEIPVEEPVEEKMVEVVEEPEKVEVQLEMVDETINGDYVVYFAFDKSDLTPEAKTVIREVVSLIYGADTYSVDVVGHTDTVGSVEYNLALGQRRADAVESFLLSEGVRADDVTTSSRGESDLAVKTEDQVRDSRNRRAIIMVTGEKN